MRLHFLPPQLQCPAVPACTVSQGERAKISDWEGCWWVSQCGAVADAIKGKWENLDQVLLVIRPLDDGWVKGSNFGGMAALYLATMSVIVNLCVASPCSIFT